MLFQLLFIALILHTVFCEWSLYWGTDVIGETPPNGPPPRVFSCHALDESSGKLWIYGGIPNGTSTIVISGRTETQMMLNDVWTFDIEKKTWEKQYGDSTGDYFIQQHFNSNDFDDQNIIGARFGSTCWFDDGKFHIWGGAGIGPDNFGVVQQTINVLSLNDLWIIDETIPNKPKISLFGVDVSSISTTNYYSRKIYDATNFNESNKPTTKTSPSKWEIDEYIYVFGGSDYTRTPISFTGSSIQTTNDMWVWSKSLKMWKFIHDSTSSTSLDTKEKGVFYSSFAPFFSMGAVNWVSSSGTLVLWSGLLDDSWNSRKMVRTLYEFNTTLSLWAWIGGDEQVLSGDDSGYDEAEENYASRSWSYNWGFGDYAFIFGGFGYINETFGSLGDYLEYDYSSRTLSFSEGTLYSGYTPDMISGDFPKHRFGGNAFTFEGKLFLFGGCQRRLDEKDTFFHPTFETISDVWYYTTFCNDIPSDDESVCNGHGDCISEDFCSCDTGYFGSSQRFCNYWSCYGLIRTDEDVCYGNGECTALDTCECEGYTETCEFPICFDVVANSSDACHGHGECVGPDNCTCETDYDFYSDCSRSIDEKVCFDIDADDEEVCSGHGTCLSLDNCDCYEGYTSSDCSVRSIGFVYKFNFYLIFVFLVLFM